jgi:hypothetical protein
VRPKSLKYYISIDEQAGGVHAHVGVFYFIDVYERLKTAVLRLEQVSRLHQAEAATAMATGTAGSPRLIAEAWTSANGLLAQAVADLRSAETALAAQTRAICAALPDSA